jgi:hypothetical protein
MKRRQFVIGSMGVLGASLHLKALSAVPCPPALDGSTVPICGDSSLAEVALSLAPGRHAAFTENRTQHPLDIQWNTLTIYYDSARRELQYVGKPASSQSQLYSHYLYSESSRSWQRVTQIYSDFGHVWSSAFDASSGDYYFRRHADNHLHRFVRANGVSAGSWTQTSSQASPALSEGNITWGALGWHPNLFGDGVPGLLVWGAFRFFAYNPATDRWSVLNQQSFESGTPYRARSGGQAVYLPGPDQLICFAQDRYENGENAVLISAGAGNSSDVIGEGYAGLTSKPPIVVAGLGGNEIHGHVVNHPDDPNRLLLLEERGTARVWGSDDHGASWQLKNYSHPFNSMHNSSAGEWTCGVIPDYGVVIGMTSNSSGGETLLWKPGD